MVQWMIVMIASTAHYAAYVIGYMTNLPKTLMTKIQVNFVMPPPRNWHQKNFHL